MDEFAESAQFGTNSVFQRGAPYGTRTRVSAV